MVFLTIFYSPIYNPAIFYCHRFSLCLAGDNTKFIDFNTHCCPKIRLCGWQNANHFTLVYRKVRFMLNNQSFEIARDRLLPSFKRLHAYLSFYWEFLATSLPISSLRRFLEQFCEMVR